MIRNTILRNNLLALGWQWPLPTVCTTRLCNSKYSSRRDIPFFCFRYRLGKYDFFLLTYVSYLNFGSMNITLLEDSEIESPTVQRCRWESTTFYTMWNTSTIVTNQWRRYVQGPFWTPAYSFTSRGNKRTVPNWFKGNTTIAQSRTSTVVSTQRGIGKGWE